MKTSIQILLPLAALAASTALHSAPPAAPAAEQFLQLALAGDDGRPTADEQLKIDALEALMAAPPEKALPLLKKVLAGTHDDAIKRRALFVLGQIELPEAQALLLATARDNGSTLQAEAIRTIGIGGDRQSLSALADLYRSGNSSLRESVLQAYLIADDAAAVYAIAKAAQSDEEFNQAVDILGAMGATEQLGLLADSGNTSQGLIQAYAIAGDLEGLQKIAAQTDDAEQRAAALRGMGIIGSAEAKAGLMQAYRQAANEQSREAALQGMLISDYDEGVLELFRASRDSAEKRRLLRVLMNMDSDLVLQVIDSTLEGE